MQLTPKEASLLKDLKGQEQLCVDKYNRHAASANDPQLKNLFEQIAQRTLWPVTWSITWPGPLLRLSETFPWFLTRISLCFKAITPGPTRTLTSGFGESSGNSSTFLRKDPLKFTMTSVPWRKWMFWAPTPH